MKTEPQDIHQKTGTCKSWGAEVFDIIQIGKLQSGDEVVKIARIGSPWDGVVGRDALKYCNT